jgi:hypothetical protein
MPEFTNIQQTSFIQIVTQVINFVTSCLVRARGPLLISLLSIGSEAAGVTLS